MTTRGGTQSLNNSNAVNELVQLLAKYDWNSPTPPRGYQYGYGRGARPIATIPGEGTAHGPHSKRTEGTVDLQYLDFVVSLTEKSEKKPRLEQHSSTNAAQPTAALKLDMQDIATIPAAKKAMVKKSAREETATLDSTPSAIALFSDEQNTGPAPLDLVVQSKKVDAADPKSFSDEQLSTLLTYGSDEDQDALIVRARAHLQLHGIRRALAVLEDGCKRTGQQGPRIWIERLNLMAQGDQRGLNDPAAARLVAEEAVKAFPKSEELWRCCISRQPESLRREMLQRAVLEFPECESLWVSLLDDTPSLADQKKILKKALAVRPDLPVLWVSLANLETHDNGRKLLGAAVEQCSPSAELLIKAATFEAKHNCPEMVRDIVRKAYRHFVATKTATNSLPREQWMALAKDVAHKESYCREVASEMVLVDVLQEDDDVSDPTRKNSPAVGATHVSATWLDDVLTPLGYEVLDDGIMLHTLSETIIKLQEVQGGGAGSTNGVGTAENSGVEPLLPPLAQLILGSCAQQLPRETSIPLLHRVVSVYGQANVANLIFCVRALYDMGALQDARRVVTDGITRCPGESLLFAACAKIEVKIGVADTGAVLAVFRKGLSMAPTPYLYKKMLVYMRADVFSFLERAPMTPIHDLTRLCHSYEEGLHEAVSRFPKDPLLWLMLLQHRAFMIDRTRRAGGLLNQRELSGSMQRLQELTQQALSPDCVRQSPIVWAYVAHALHSDLLLNVHAARATLLEASEVFSSRPRDDVALSPLHMARINVELKHGGRSAALSVARDAIGSCGSRHAAVVAAYIDLEVPAQRPKAAYTALTVWRVHAAEVYLSVAKVYFLAKMYDRADDQVRKAIDQNPRCGDAYAMKYRLVSEKMAIAKQIGDAESSSDAVWQSHADAVVDEATKAQPNAGQLWIALMKEQGYGMNVTLTGPRLSVGDAVKQCARCIVFA